MACSPRYDSSSARRTRRPSSAARADVVVQRILATVDSIPSGSVASYGDVARAAGLPGRARLVGRILRELPNGARLPWHRVLATSGVLSVSGASASEQRRRLARERVTFDARGRVRAEHFTFRP